MAYFPLFIDLTEKKILIVGGGATAERKVEKLLAYGADLTVLAPHEPVWLKEYPVSYIPGTYHVQALDNVDFVVAAVNSPAVNALIFHDASERGILCCSVDDPSSSSFIFGATILEGLLSIGISTSGASPAGAKYLREQIQSALPAGIESILDYLQAKRSIILKSVSSGKKRTQIFQQLFFQCLENAEPVSEEQFQKILEEINV